jgi:hypothetical protein
VIGNVITAGPRFFSENGSEGSMSNGTVVVEHPTGDRCQRRRAFLLVSLSHRLPLTGQTSSPTRTRPTTGTPGPPAPLTQVESLEALRRQQQRILQRSALIDYVLAAERRSGRTFTMGDAHDRDVDRLRECCGATVRLQAR